MQPKDTYEYEMMALALELAESAFKLDEVPVGAVIASRKERSVIASSYNQMKHKNPTAHAELSAIQDAFQKTGKPFLDEYDLFVTLEPCTMCAGAISLARLRSVYFSAFDPKGGGVDHGAKFFNRTTCHHKPEVISGLLSQESETLLKAFFKLKR